MNIETQVYDSKYTLWWYSSALLVMCFGSVIAAQYYPGGYDLFYNVASALASHKHNPDGSVWFAASLSLSMVLLWVYVSSLSIKLTAILPESGFSITAIRIGLVSGFFLGAERLFVYDLSSWLYKSHETLAIFTLLGLYIGILGLLLKLINRSKRNLLPVLLIVSPLMIISIRGFWLYLDQHDIGWVNTNWREKGIPLWLSFAFWQWLAIGFLWAGLGLVHILINKKQEKH